MYILCGTSEDQVGKLLGSWYATNFKSDFSPPYGAIGFISQSGVVGVSLFSDYNGSNIEMHFFGPGCITKKNFKYVLNYVFNKLNCNRFTVKPYSGHKKLIDIVERLGFKYEAHLKNYYGLSDDEDAVMYYMTKIDAEKWIKVNA